MKAVFSKDLYSTHIVLNTLTREKVYNTLILFPSLDPSSLVAMKAYIDAAANEKDADPKHLHCLRLEYERIKLTLDGIKEFAAWEERGGK